MTPDGISRLQADEGLRLHPYKDTSGKLTIGRGRCLDTHGITEAEADALFANDVTSAEAALSGVSWFVALDPVRRDAVINMAFNLGIAGLLEFHHMAAALAAGNFEQAAKECLDSQAARQLPARYGRLAAALRTGAW